VFLLLEVVDWDSWAILSHGTLFDPPAGPLLGHRGKPETRATAYPSGRAPRLSEVGTPALPSLSNGRYSARCGRWADRVRTPHSGCREGRKAERSRRLVRWP